MGKLRVPREALKNVRAVKLDVDGMKSGEERLLCVNLEKIATVTLWARSAERLF